jgi:hypothetical protein
MQVTRRQLLAGSAAAGVGALLSRPFAGMAHAVGAEANAAEAERFLHPFAQAQPTTTGRKINTLHAHAGRLYTGYGDANNTGGGNTGPIRIASLDPATGTWQDHLLFQTEKVSRYRLVAGKLVTTANDPRGGGDEFLAMQQSDGQWTSLSQPVNQLHVYDICQGRAAGELWACGSASGPTHKRAQVWRSTDGGSTWRQAFDPGPIIVAAVDQACAGRYYHIAYLGGKVFTQLLHDPSSWVHQGGDDRDWIPGPNLNCFQYPVLFDGKLVYGDRTPDVNDPLAAKDVPTTGVLRTLAPGGAARDHRHRRPVRPRERAVHRRERALPR